MKLAIAMLVLALPASVFAVDGVVLINQSTVTAAGGFPYSISQPGSYKLSGNLVVPSGVNGIQITASNVTLDLNGFSITNFNNNGVIFYLVQTVGAVTGVRVQNGTILFASGTVPIDTSSATGTVAEDLTLIQPGGGGAAFFGSWAILRRVLFPSPGGGESGGGILVTCPAVVVDSLAAIFFRNTNSSTACTFGNSSGALE
jgi:hypothetical protein